MKFISIGSGICDSKIDPLKYGVVLSEKKKLDTKIGLHWGEAIIVPGSATLYIHVATLEQYRPAGTCTCS